MRCRPRFVLWVSKREKEALIAQPERNGRSIFNELQLRYAGQFANGQIRTLQRRIAAWRAKTIVTFDDGWSDELAHVEQPSLPLPLRVAVEQHAESPCSA